MSDYHILAQAKNKKSVNVVLHIPVPAAGNNQAGKTWPEAVVLEQGGQANINSVLPALSGSQEETSMKAGELIEVSASVHFSSINLTPAERKLEVIDEFNKVKTALIAEKQDTLAWIGESGNAP